MKQTKIWLVLAWAVTLLGSSSVQGATLIVSYDDPVGDFQEVSIDLIGMTLIFDNTTGDYELTVKFDDANPFVGSHNVNANLFNATVTPLTTDPAFVGINETPAAAVATNMLVFTGTDTNLMSWEQGDLVANNTSVFGNPEDASFTSFLSAVQDDGLGIDILDPASSAIATIPLPATLWLLSSGIVALIGVARGTTD
jgi:hypothetical protein